MDVEQTIHLALQHHGAGRLADAEHLYRQVLSQQPSHAVALHSLGLIACQVGRFDVGVDLIKRAIRVQPNYAAAYNNLGGAYRARGQLEEAIAAHRQAIALEPNNADAFSNLGNALRDSSRLDEAIAAYRQAIALNPNFAEAYSNLGNALRERGQLDEAVATCRQAIVLKPNNAGAYSNLGAALLDKGELDDAVAACRQAIGLRSNEANTWNSLASALRQKANYQEAVTTYRQAIALSPELAVSHWNLGLTLLLLGDFVQGWAEFEWRWRWSEFPSERRGFKQPLWKGEDLAGKTILLYAEQGLGDTLQFARYVSMVAALGGRVVVECQPELKKLLQASLGDATVVAKGDALPAFDFQMPLLSLPLVFKTDASSIPRPLPYIVADPEKVQHWRERLAFAESSLKVGFVWAGRPQHTNDRNRSLRLSFLKPLLTIEGVRCFSLQKGETAGQIRSESLTEKLTDWTSELQDFSDTAAFVANLDLVITVDTSVAHLTGAMGKAVWVLLPFVPDWRWMLERADSPWYPGMRLFRQSKSGDWGAVIEQVGESLGKLAGA